jgi:hypothetical protein
MIPDQMNVRYAWLSVFSVWPIHHRMSYHSRLLWSRQGAASEAM